jgi:hypothetical protein
MIEIGDAAPCPPLRLFCFLRLRLPAAHFRSRITFC